MSANYMCEWKQPAFRSVDLGVAVLLLSNGKVILAPKGSDEHVTLRVGLDCGELDLHLAYGPGGPYRTLLRIPHDAMPGLASEIASPALFSLSRALQKLGPRTLPLNADLVACEGMMLQGDALYTVCDVRKRRLILNQSRFAAGIRWFDELDEIHELADGRWFTIFALRRNQRPKKLGSGVNVDHEFGRRSTFWLSERRLQAACTDLEFVMGRALSKFETDDLVNSQ